MSSSEPVNFTPLRGTRKSGGERFHLQVRAQQRTGATSGDTRITVRNGWDELVSEGYGQIALDLERGLYTLRLERGGASREEVIRHIATSKFEPIEPQRSSALPTFDTWDAHEYYSWTAQSLSHQNTGAAATVFGDLQAAGRLFIFVRAVEAGKWPVLDPFEGLLLFDLNGKYLTGFGPEVVARHGLDAWAAFSAPAPAGTYLLRYVGLEPHEMVLSVFAGWETQLFVPYGHRPHLSRASLLLARLGQGFHPDDRVAQAIDAGVGGLESGVDILPQEGRRLLLSGKFDNPMLGLIGAHLLLLNTEPDWQLLRIVLGNLENLLPGAADVRALRIAIALRRGEGSQITPARVPPMLRRGLDAIIEASSTMPEIVPEGGVIERIPPYLLAETPWSISALPGSGVAETRDADMPAWVHNLLEDARNEALRQNRSPDLTALAQQAKLPLAQLRRWLTQFDLAL